MNVHIRTVSHGSGQGLGILGDIVRLFGDILVNIMRSFRDFGRFFGIFFFTAGLVEFNAGLVGFNAVSKTLHFTIKNIMRRTLGILGEFWGNLFLTWF